ncbi:MarR family winged helix-turn-helix transcriptional regulator [Gordonia sp. CPCC 205333]|uniref:MarR family winged helix-turn-helix transcriptional regulator n=1 Tax=Gordonia sp. CPCC 205333 TaxID=3140790 RepID=UPI003AF3616E
MTEQTPSDGELLGREFITAIVVFHDAVGRSLGLSAVERKTIDILRRTGPAPASEISRQTGLTSGAVTGLVDRLAERGYAERSPDPNDRRRVLVSLVDDPDLNRHLAAIFGPLGDDMAELMATFSASELAAITTFQRVTTDILRTHTARVSRGRGEKTPRPRGD